MMRQESQCDDFGLVNRVMASDEWLQTTTFMGIEAAMHCSWCNFSSF